MPIETVDAVVVGTRCAGSSVAAALARAGRRVVGLDSSAFPSDTLSTHLLWPSGVAELERLGALERVRAIGAPPLTTAYAVGAGHVVRAPFTAYRGVDFGMCVRRPGLDAALVATAREAGAELRERCRVVDLVRDGNRVVGVHYVDRSGDEHELRARIVVGADGRRSTVARLVGVGEPYRSKPSGRACYFGYWHDGRDEWRDVAAQWRSGTSLGTAFPCDGGLLLCLIQPAAQEPRHVVGRADAAYQEMIADIPGLSERLRGCTMAGRVRSAVGITSYFRRSSGPGWALPGDAGHFKDPVTAQGIRDALRYGRLLGEIIAPVLEDSAALDVALRGWERRRELDCLDMYQWTNRLARGEGMTALEVELYRAAASDPDLARAVVEVMSRVRAPHSVMDLSTRARLAAAAMLRGTGGRVAAGRDVARDIGDTFDEWHERQSVRLDGILRVQASAVGYRPSRSSATPVPSHILY
ncbi:NAD(P)/FAD-dependent oxidoreductase [Nocardia vinacea]|uniref:NAD(P)/FAD-dependent oxidoreductase n=1 Tax=Nocardia vinacea TaxID=96468 RepID=UPI0002E0BD87|nr:NAD(P)/FAD-dependent oxidoreductase [Nocardia vinacea]